VAEVPALRLVLPPEQALLRLPARVQEPYSERGPVPVPAQALSPVRSRSDPQAPELLPAQDSRCWPADFASCNHRQAADLPGRMEGESGKNDG
jgi:hypothetical protein